MTIWTVYQHVDRDGAVLYVGCSSNLDKRARQHATGSAWWPQVAAVETVRQFDERADALACEADLIDEGRPPNNIVGNVETSSRYIRGQRSVKPKAEPKIFEGPPSPKAVWIIFLTGRAAHALESTERTRCGLDTTWRQMVLHKPTDEDVELYPFPRCSRCEASLTEPTSEQVAS